MPITYVPDEARRSVRTRVTGSVTPQDILAHYHTASEQKFLDFAELIDAREVNAPFLTTAEIWRTASLVRAFETDEPFGPRAVVVASDLMFGMARMFSNLISDFFPMKVFRDEIEAEEWLAGQQQSLQRRG